MDASAISRSSRSLLVPPGGADLHQSDMTATFSADVTLESALQQLAHIDQWLPIDGTPDESLGQLIDQNSTGPLRLGYGAWRDLLLGLQFFNGRGDLISAGGRTVKNVAGYDLTKFMVGQRGQFGRLATVTLRTYRRPAAALHVTLPTERHSEFNELFASPLRPQWAVLAPGSYRLGYLGDERTLSYLQGKLPEINPTAVERVSVETDIARRLGLWHFGQQSFRASIPPTRIMEFVQLAKLERWSADVAFGIVVGPKPEQMNDIQMAAGVTSGNVRTSDAAIAPSNEIEGVMIDRLRKAFRIGDAAAIDTSS